MCVEHQFKSNVLWQKNKQTNTGGRRVNYHLPTQQLPLEVALWLAPTLQLLLCHPHLSCTWQYSRLVEPLHGRCRHGGRILYSGSPPYILSCSSIQKAWSGIIAPLNWALNTGKKRWQVLTVYCLGLSKLFSFKDLRFLVKHIEWISCHKFLVLSVRPELWGYLAFKMAPWKSHQIKTMPLYFFG